ncbi:nickel transport system ATP-binding protein [Planomicrobium soli]|uniref:Nickel transport system ATP-binding protein n=1 Tax=Planomicrobium soli TaxID=1176648 RepID=A0A2P8H468_9BACL|nr:nickel import ATP-binding protein NikE [Planomicrobium soli]PSL40999.1 nickel transport system ATP-binding protein [Planomicrobium soli]
MDLLEVKNVSHTYGSRRLFERTTQETPVLSDVSFSMQHGTCLGLLGSSGAGKSTLGKIILGLEKPKKGQILFEGQDLYSANAQTRKQIRRDLQVVFQDCYSSVNPRMTAEKIVAEPLENYEKLSPSELQRTVARLLDRVGLKTEDMKKFPRQFSGGQLQRLNIARAIALKPKLIVMDEPISSLDMVNQANILNLLDELKADYDLSYLFITHDIRAAYTVADELAVMEKGEVVEYCPDKKEIFNSTNPTVKKLISAILLEHPMFRTKKPLRTIT